MKTTVWLKSVPSESLQNVLKEFKDVEISESDEYVKGADLDIIFGSWKDRDIPYHNLKRQVVKNSKNVLVLETPLLERGPQKEIMDDKWFRVGLNGFMRNAQWAPLSQDRMSYNLAQNSISSDGISATDYILLVLQLPGDASLDFINIDDWCLKKVEQIRELTDRDIVIRFPQLDREFHIVEKLEKVKNVYYQKGEFKDKTITLNNAYCVVTYSSGMGVEAILNGNRTFIESENGFWSKRSELKEVLDRQYLNFVDGDHAQKWMKSIEQTQWHIDEIKSGACLNAFKELLK